MCISFINVQPGAEWPLVMAAVRDENLLRESQPAGRWWPSEYPNAIGERDCVAGGTWLAVDPTRMSVASVFTRGATKPPFGRSRGELPLLALHQRGDVSAVAGESSPFSLFYYDNTSVAWCQWDGGTFHAVPICPGFHVASFDGLDVPRLSKRQAKWLPLFAEAFSRNRLGDGAIENRWRGWLPLFAETSDRDRDDALLSLHRNGVESYGTRSVALIAVGVNKIHYDVADEPIKRDSWTTVGTS